MDYCNFIYNQLTNYFVAKVQKTTYLIKGVIDEKQNKTKLYSKEYNFSFDTFIFIDINWLHARK